MRTIEEIKEVSFEGFQVVSGKLFKNTMRMNQPTITLWYNCISFSKAAMIALNNCERVRIEVNPETKRILLIPVTSSDTDAVHWVKTGKELKPRKIECSGFTSQLFERWDWDKKYVYRAIGRIVSFDKKLLLLFDFSEPQSWLMKGKAMAGFNG